MASKNYTPLNKTLSLPGNRNGQVVARTGGLSKEQEPLLKKDVDYQEVVEHEPSQEVVPFVQKRAETIKLPPDLKKIGLKVSSISQTTSYKNVKIPISDDKVISGMKAPITSSLRWLATLALYLLRQAHLSLRVVHGHAVRILKK